MKIRGITTILQNRKIGWFKHAFLPLSFVHCIVSPPSGFVLELLISDMFLHTSQVFLRSFTHHLMALSNPVERSCFTCLVLLQSLCICFSCPSVHGLPITGMHEVESSSTAFPVVRVSHQLTSIVSKECILWCTVWRAIEVELQPKVSKAKPEASQKILK